jgi:flagellar hook-basal body complex protein FliE
MNHFISNIPVFPNGQVPSSPSTSGREESDSSFKETLHSAINQVEEMQSSAEQQMTELLKGDRGDVQNVMIAVEKADIAFQLMMQVRNKIVNAYQEVSRMQF